MKNISILCFFGCLLFMCTSKSHEKDMVNANPKMDDIPSPTRGWFLANTSQLDKDAYHDKVLGALVGSAIGDAMGASTEMWHFKDIQNEYGYISGLTDAIRTSSPEGTWMGNMVKGSTTDDTRWKFLVTQYLIRNKNNLNSNAFSEFIEFYYTQLLDKVPKAGRLGTQNLDEQIEKIEWIKEWARIAIVRNKSIDSFTIVKDRFYGGEMACGGLLYAPVFGLITPNPETGYEMAYDHSFYDIGYARDISAISAAMTNVALTTKHFDSIMQVALRIDPMGFSESRLVGRISENILKKSKVNVKKDAVNLIGFPVSTPENYPGHLVDWQKEWMTYQNLETSKEAIAFHAGEIWEILCTGLYFGQGDFMRTIQFIVNYGRDNDTVAAVAGMILGAYIGFNELPQEIKQQVVQVNKENLGIDLEKLAQQITDFQY